MTQYDIFAQVVLGYPGREWRGVMLGAAGLYEDEQDFVD